jgi:hypothetical protein
MGYCNVVKNRYSREPLEYPNNSLIFRGFWKDADRTKKFLVDLFSHIDVPKKSIVVTSVFPSISFTEKVVNSIRSRMHKKLSIEEIQRISYGHIAPLEGPNIINVWYTGENSRIPSSPGWNAFLSFDADRIIDKSIFLPFWATRLGDSISAAEKRQNALLTPRNLDAVKKQGICAVVGNPEPMRLNFIRHLQKQIPVDVFGNINGNYVQDKSLLLSKYTFNVCFENDLYPNYITEKIFESWDAGCIPVWWGADQAKYLNPDAYINLGTGNFSQTINLIDEMSQSEEKIKKMINSPILQKPFDYASLINQLKNLIEEKT